MPSTRAPHEEASSEMTEAKQIPERSRRKEADCASRTIAKVCGTTAGRFADWIQARPSTRHVGRRIEGGEERHELNHLGSGR